MFSMSSSMVLSDSVIFNCNLSPNSSCVSRNRSKFVVRLNCNRRRKLCGLVPYAKKSSNGKRNWWKRFFFDDDGNWFGWNDYVELDDELERSYDEEVSEEEKFEAWKRRAEAIVELREAQDDMRMEESRRWEDWLVEGNDGVGTTSSWVHDWDDKVEELREDVLLEPGEMIPKKGLAESVRDAIFGQEDDEMLYEDRVFRYASFNSAKFVAVLIIIPWALDFVVHDFVLMPFLDRYVKLVPLAAEVLDVRRYQKLEMVKELNVEKARFRLEVEIGESPPLSDEEVWLELREKALELRDEWRLENRRAFANIWSDMVFGITLFLLLYFNQSKVALLKFTGYKLINNTSDIRKALCLLFIADTILGYHSITGWDTLSEAVLEHYGFEIDHIAVTLFVGLFPVALSGLMKIWLFKVLPSLSPKVARLFEEVGRNL